MAIKGICLKVLFLVLWAKCKVVQDLKTGVLLHGPIVKDMVSYLNSTGLTG
jgi:hypothetical protein